MKLFECVKIGGVAGVAIALVSAVLQILFEVMSRAMGYGAFYRTDFITGIYIGAGIAITSLAIMALVALTAVVACFLAEVCSKRSPAMEAFFERIARSLVSQMKG